jgi:hypothetical protein
MPTDEAREIAGQVEADVSGRLGHYFVPDADAGFVGFEAVESFGDEGIVSGSSDSGSSFTFVRWQYGGRHLGAIPSRFGGDDVAQPTGNPVIVDGLTVIEHRGDGEVRARWFVDWLSVYTQIGVVTPGRPTRMENIEVRSPFEPEVVRARSRRGS